MPQLDFIIILPQIFWFFLIFISLYLYVLHYFLPKLIFSLKFRKLVVKKNNLEILKLNSAFIKQKKLLNSKLIYDLKSFKSCFFFNLKKINNIFIKQKYSNPEILNKKVLSFIVNTNLFCSKQILNAITILPSHLNSQK